MADKKRGPTLSIKPHHTQIPDAYLDIAMRGLSPATFKVLMAISRMTFGWQKTEESISVATLIEYTALSNRGVMIALEILEANKVIFVNRGDWKSSKANRYRVNLEWDGSLNSVQREKKTSLNSVLRGPLNSVQRDSLNSVQYITDIQTKKTDNISAERASSLFAKQEASDAKQVKRILKNSANAIIHDSDSAEAIVKSRKCLNLPQWLDVSVWQEFKRTRQRMRKPMTPRAEELMLKDLAKLKDQGHDPTEVLEQSIKKSWLGVFPIKAERQQSRFSERTERLLKRGLDADEQEVF